MAYTVLLNAIIEESKLTVKEIAERCKNYNVDVTPAYISTLRNDKKNRAPSDKVSRAIAKACEYKDTEALVVEAYLDSAPDIIRKFFSIMKKSVIPTMLGVFENKFTTQQIKEIETIIDQIPMTQFISEIANQGIKIEKMQGAFNTKIISNDDIRITQEIKQTLGLPVEDDGMKPLICKGNLIQIESKQLENLKTGDIICYTKPANAKKVYVRKIVLSDSKKQFTLLPMNSEYAPEMLSSDDIMLMGKVVRVTAEIK